MAVVRFSLIVALLLPAISGAEETSLRTFPLPDLGSLQLNVPHSWKVKFRQAPHGFPPIIVFIPPQGKGFQILLTPMWNTRTGAVPEKDDLYRIVARAAEEAKRQSVEQSIPILELTGESCTGYYFSATDRSSQAWRVQVYDPGHASDWGISRDFQNSHQRRRGNRHFRRATNAQRGASKSCHSTVS